MGFSMQNLSNSLLKMGTSFLQLGTFYAAAKSINHGGCGGSIFGSGCCGGGGSYYGIGYSSGPMFYGGGFGLGQIAADRYMMGQMYAAGFAANQQLNCLTSMNGAMYPAMTGMPTLNMNLPGLTTTTSTTTQPLQKTNNPTADKVDKEQSTALAQKYEQNIKDNKSTTFVSDSWKDMPEGAEKNDAHRDASNNFAKSYIMHMDKSTGNSDGEITLDEFKAYNIKTDLGDDVSDDMKKAANESSAVIFNTLDQNGDGKLDWKEMSSMFPVYDGMKDGKYDGVITNEELEAGNTLMLDKNNQTIDQKLRDAYKDIFNP